MEFYLPSLMLFLLALGVVFGLIPKMSPFLLGVVALVLLVLTAYSHYSIFKNEYAIQSWADKGKIFAPYILIGTVIVFSLGYLLYLFGMRGSSGLKMPSSPAYAPPETATNVFTEAVGNVIKNANLSANTPSRPLLSKNASLNITSSEARNVQRERLAEQV